MDLQTLLNLVKHKRFVIIIIDNVAHNTGLSEHINSIATVVFTLTILSKYSTYVVVLFQAS